MVAAMAKGLPSWLVDALPEPARAKLVAHAPGPRQLALRFDSGAVIDIQLAADEPRAFVTTGALCFGYRTEGEGDTKPARELCEALADALGGPVGDPLARWLETLARTDPPAPVHSPRATMILSEGEFLRGRDLSVLTDATEVETVELYLDQAACVQHCRFCAYPLVRARQRSFGARLRRGLRVLGQATSAAPDVLGWLDRVIAIMRSRPSGCVMLSGPDCLRHPQIDAILDRLAAAPEIGVALLGPLTRLADPDMAARIAAIPGLRAIQTSLLSPHATIHDNLVGTSGAHAEVLAALASCEAHGIPFTINVLVAPANVAALPELLALCLDRGATGVNLSLYHPESASDMLVHASWRELDVAALVVRPAALIEALSATPRAVLEHVHGHYLPRCWVPAELRELLSREGRDPQDNFTYLPACADCRERRRCPGVTVPAAECLGSAAVQAID
jgi:hypothetical protein